MITNSKSIAEDIYYVQRDEFVKWAIKALDGVRYAYKLFHVEGISRQKLKDLY